MLLTVVQVLALLQGGLYMTACFIKTREQKGPETEYRPEKATFFIYLSFAVLYLLEQVNRSNSRTACNSRDRDHFNVIILDAAFHMD